MNVKTELQVRDEYESIDRFEEVLKLVSESLKTENKSTIIQNIQGLSVAFDNVIKSLEKVDMNVSKLITNLSCPILTWLILTLAVAEVMKVGKIRL